MLKNNGKERKSKQRRYKDTNCEACGCKIRINQCIEIDDFDYVDSSKDKIYVYCPECGLQRMYKL